MLRFVLATSLAAAFGLSCSSSAIADDGVRFPSRIGSMNLFMRHQGATAPRRGPPVLFLHGATFPSANSVGWKIDGRSWMDELASAGSEVYALDFLGYGRSDRFPEMASDTAEGAPLGDMTSMVTQVESAVAHILREHGGESVNLVAHSAGTFVAARFAELHPDNVARLVLFGAPAPYAERSEQTAEVTRFTQVSRADQLEAFEPRVRDTHHLDLDMFDAWANVYLATDPQSTDRHPPSVRVPSGMIAAVAEMSHFGRVPYDPHQITRPVLVIQGEWDAVAPPAAGMWLYKRLGSALKRFVVISRAGHRAHLERSRWQLYREIESFLNGGDDISEPVHAVFFEAKPRGKKGREQISPRPARFGADSLRCAASWASSASITEPSRVGCSRSLCGATNRP